MQTFALLTLAACVVAVPSPEHISIDISVDSNSGHGVSQNYISTAKKPFGTNDGGYCIPFYGHQCSAGEENYRCCEPFSCMDDRSGQSVKRCLPKEHNDHEVKSKKSSSSTKGKNDDNDICLPPWEDGHMLCGIGSPKYKCCADHVFSCQEFGKSGMYGCQPKRREETSSVATKDVEKEDEDDNMCLPPWDIAHMFCGIGEKKFKCCGEDMECKKLGGRDSTGYGCLYKNDNRDSQKKLSLGERIFRPEMR